MPTKLKPIFIDVVIKKAIEMCMISFGCKSRNKFFIRLISDNLVYAELKKVYSLLKRGENPINNNN